MIEAYKKEANKYLLIGFFTWFAGNGLQYLAKQTVEPDMAGLMLLVGLVLRIAGMLTFVYGCSQYSMAKGQSKYWGGLGIFSLIGLVILVILPDRHSATLSKEKKQ